MEPPLAVWPEWLVKDLDKWGWWRGGSSGGGRVRSCLEKASKGRSLDVGSCRRCYMGSSGSRGASDCGRGASDCGSSKHRGYQLPPGERNKPPDPKNMHANSKRPTESLGNCELDGDSSSATLNGCLPAFITCRHPASASEAEGNETQSLLSIRHHPSVKHCKRA